MEPIINPVPECQGLPERFLDVRLEVSSDGVRADSGKRTDFPQSSVQMPLEALVAHTATGTKLVGCCGNVSDIYLKWSSFGL